MAGPIFDSHAHYLSHQFDGDREDDDGKDEFNIFFHRRIRNQDLKKRQGYDDEKHVFYPGEHQPPPILTMVEMNVMKSKAVKNVIAPIEMTQLPISLTPAEILPSVSGSISAPVNL